MMGEADETGQRSLRVAIVVAAARNGVIGRDGGLPWRMPSDLKAFRRLTMGKPIVMGRRTFQSIGKPLDGRPHIVVTRDASFAAGGVIVEHELGEALSTAARLAACDGAEEVMVIGGAEIYAASEPRADRIYLTLIEAEIDGDVRFAVPDPADPASPWQLTADQRLETSERDQYPARCLIFDRRVAPAPSGPSNRDTGTA